MIRFSYRKAGLCSALILCTMFHSFTAFAAENRDDYRLVFDADYYYNEYPDLQEPLRIAVDANEGTLTVSLYLGEESQEEAEDPVQEEPAQESEAPENEIVGPARDLVKTETETTE